MRGSHSQIVDTGCGRDLDAKHPADAWRDYHVEAQPINLYTANGPTSSTDAIHMSVSAFKQTCDAYILEKTPAVLSVGKRVMHSGFAFVWLPGKQPAMILPDMDIIPLKIHGDIPFLDADY